MTKKKLHAAGQSLGQTAVATHRVAGEDGMVHARSTPCPSSSRSLTSLWGYRKTSSDSIFPTASPTSHFRVVRGSRVFSRWTGDVHVHAGYNTLRDAVINRRQKRVDVQGVQVGKSHSITLQMGESWQRG